MTLRNYSSTAVQTTLSVGINSSTTSVTVVATTGFPTAPFILALDADGASQEIVLVTAVAGTTLTATRGYDGTTAVSHDAGAIVRHSHAAIEFAEANTHVNATAAVHGLAGTVVGTTDTQTLTNKTISADSNTVNGFAASSFLVSDGTGKADGSAAQKVIPTGVVVGTTDTQTLTGKTVSADDNTLNGFAASSFVVTDGTGKADGSAAQKAIPAGVVVGTTDTQTLTNKTLTAPTITGVGQTLFARKTGSESVTSSTTFQDDDDLVLAVESGAVYEFRAVLVYDGDSAGDLKYQIAIPGGTVVASRQSLVSTAAGTSDDGAGFLDATTVATAGTLGVGTQATVLLVGLVTIDTTGDLKVRWAQNTSNATATRLLAGSFVTLRRVA